MLAKIIQKLHQEMELKAEKFVSECFGIELNCRDVTELRFIELTWYIPDDAVERLYSKALQCKYNFIHQLFLF